MTMTFFLHESIQPNAQRDLIRRGGAAPQRQSRSTAEHPLFVDKLKAPLAENVVSRERLTSMLERSQAQFPATLISGRAGTGKTVLASLYASTLPATAWYTVETGDTDWNAFARYFSASLEGVGIVGSAGNANSSPRYDPQNEIARFLARHFLKEESTACQKGLIVLDDMHHVFDTPWFDEFFKLLLYSLPPSLHLLMLCRSKPPAPLWRLRSKQVLNVIEEDQLAFTVEETAELFRLHSCTGLDPSTVAYEYFGRASKLIELANGVSAA